MTREVRVATDDLGTVIDLLAGLVTILEDFDTSGRGSAQADQLLEVLQHDAAYSDIWEALRYGSSIGWSSVITNVSALRERLLSTYGEAALEDES